MKATSYMKNHKENEFYVKKAKGIFLVIDSYDMSAEFALTEEEAKKMAAELNAMRNKRLNIA